MREVVPVEDLISETFDVQRLTVPDQVESSSLRQDDFSVNHLLVM
jgi:hypothetical protein